jgi:hypothetical protein
MAVARTDNMFRTWEFDVKKLLKAGENRIEITFDSVLPLIRAKEEERPLPTWAYPGAAGPSTDCTLAGGKGEAALAIGKPECGGPPGWGSSRSTRSRSSFSAPTGNRSTPRRAGSACGR